MSEPFDTGPDAPSLAAQMDARGWPHPPVVGGEDAVRILASMDARPVMPPDCPGCGKLWTQLPEGHWWRLDGYRYSCTGPGEGDAP